MKYATIRRFRDRPHFYGIALSMPRDADFEAGAVGVDLKEVIRAINRPIGGGVGESVEALDPADLICQEHEEVECAHLDMSVQADPGAAAAAFTAGLVVARAVEVLVEAGYDRIEIDFEATCDELEGAPVAGSKPS